MKTLSALFVGVFLFLLFTTEMAMASSWSSSERKRSLIEFSSLPENHGRPWRVIERRYEEYRLGRLAERRGY